MMFSFVLSDQLCVEYYKFLQQKDYDKKIIKKLLTYYNGEFLSNTAQLNRNAITVSKQIKARLKYSGYTTQNLEDLSKKTLYKHILNIGNTNFPYIDIFSDQITSSITGCFYRDMQRNKAIDHLKSLCANASTIYFYDLYMDNAYNILPLILPDKAVTIIYKESMLSNDHLNWLKTQNNKWIFDSRQRLLTHHDRYIIIDNKIEILLTSGFLYLTHTHKELSYIVRPIEKNRLLL